MKYIEIDTTVVGIMQLIYNLNLTAIRMHRVLLFKKAQVKIHSCGEPQRRYSTNDSSLREQNK